MTISSRIYWGTIGQVRAIFNCMVILIQETLKNPRFKGKPLSRLKQGMENLRFILLYYIPGCYECGKSILFDNKMS